MIEEKVRRVPRRLLGWVVTRPRSSVVVGELGTDQPWLHRWTKMETIHDSYQAGSCPPQGLGMWGWRGWRQNESKEKRGMGTSTCTLVQCITHYLYIL